jgi:pimeloyl-ACP methyl ester carboxylesterase
MVVHASRGAVTDVVVMREGEGPEVLLVHGGASPATTWSGLEALSTRWTLLYMYRRGYPPSPPEPDGRHDFDVDADDVRELLSGRPHVVAHSYGALGAAIAATREPELVRSLTLIEPPLYLDPDDPDVARMRRLGDEVLAHGLDADPEVLREFLRCAGAPVPDSGPLPEAVAAGVRRAHGGRSPSEAHPPLEVLREAGLPCLVASGGHDRSLERICDLVAEALEGERLVSPGAGHFVAAAPGFPAELERFLRSAG